jgi:hypothetical protein
MKRAFILLAVLAVFLSPLMISQAQAAPTKQQHRVVKHHKKVVKKHAARRNVRKHKVTV